MSTQMPRRVRPSGGQNFNSTLSIVVAVVAVLIGFLILQNSLFQPKQNRSLELI